MHFFGKSLSLHFHQGALFLLFKLDGLGSLAWEKNLSLGYHISDIFLRYFSSKFNSKNEEAMIAALYRGQSRIRVCFYRFFSSYWTIYPLPSGKCTVGRGRWSAIITFTSPTSPKIVWKLPIKGAPKSALFWKKSPHPPHLKFSWKWPLKGEVDENKNFSDKFPEKPDSVIIFWLLSWEKKGI